MDPEGLEGVRLEAREGREPPSTVTEAASLKGGRGRRRGQGPPSIDAARLEGGGGAATPRTSEASRLEDSGGGSEVGSHRVPPSDEVARLEGGGGRTDAEQCRGGEAKRWEPPPSRGRGAEDGRSQEAREALASGG